MDRVNHSRKLFPASLVAVATLTLLSFSRADAPSNQPEVGETGIQQAVGVSTPQDGVIQQVVGKQPKPRKTRPGLLQVLTGSKPKGDADHQHDNMPKEDSKGLLDVLFSKDSKSVTGKNSSTKVAPKSRVTGKSTTKATPKGRTGLGRSVKAGLSVTSPLLSIEIGNTKNSTKGTNSSTTASSKTASRPKAGSKANSVNWDGIPYHSASNARQNAEPLPIRDPVQGDGSEDEGMRIIRGGSRAISARPASSRQSSEADSDDSPTTLAVPEPPRDIEPIPAPRNFSNTSSSRRRNRRTLEPLKNQPSTANASKPEALPTKTSAAPKVDDSVAETDELVPRVPRKTVQAEVAKDSLEAAPPKPVSSIVSKESGKGNSSSKAGPQILPPAASNLVDTKSAVDALNPSVLPRKAGGVTKVPRHGIAMRRPTPTPTAVAVPSQSGESQTAVAAIGVPLVATPARNQNSETGEPVQSGIPAVPEPVSSSELQVPPSVAIVPALPAGSQPANVPNIVTFPKITANAGVESGSRFPQPVLAPQPVITRQPGYTIPVAPNAPNHTSVVDAPPTLGPPAAAVSHRAGPPSDAFGSAAVGPQASPAAQPDRSVIQSIPIGSGVAIGAPTPLRTNGVGASYPSALRSGVNNGINQPSTPSFGMPTAQRQSPVADTSIAETFNGNPNRIATNFNRSAETQNRMRAPGQSNGLTNSTSELPGIRVATFGPSEVTIRQVNEYEIRVENRGAIDARGVIVRASIPDWAEMKGQNVTVGNVQSASKENLEHLVWTIDRLPAGTSEKMFIRLIAARSGNYDLDVDWTMQPQKSVAKVRVHEPRLNLSIEGPDQVIYGMSQTYKVRVLNSGDGTAPNVVFTLSPNSATPQTQRIGDIPAGKEAQFDVELTAQDLGDLEIHGLASGDLELTSESSKVIRVAAASLEAVLSGPQLKYQNAEAMYGLQLQNDGTAASENVIATLRLPAGVKYLGGMEGVVAQGNVLQWRLNSLKPGTMQNYQFRCQMTSTGEHVFAFDCAGTAAGETDVSIATRVESSAFLVVTVADPPEPAPIGSDVSYEILIRNRGSKEATNVRAVAQFGHGIEPLRIEGHPGEVVPGQVMFNAIPRIGAGAEVRLRVIAQAQKIGHHRFRAEVHSGDTMLVAEEATHYMSSQSDRVSRRSSEAGSR